MKIRMLNIIFILFGVAYIALPIIFNIDGILGFLSVCLGVAFLVIGLFKGNKPIEVICDILDLLV